MSLGKRLFIGEAAAVCSADSVQPFGDESAYISNVALYQLDSDGGTTNNVPDTVGNYNGTASNVTYSTGKYGNAAVFNGSSSNITTSGLKGYSKQTWSFWINPDVVNSRGHLMGTYPSGTIGQGAMYVELQSNGNVEAGVRNSSGSTSSVITTTPLTASQWHHIVVTSSGSELKLYINGASPITTSATVTTLDSTNVGSLAIGYEQRNNTHYFDGLIDQVRIYDKALSSFEVDVLYNETTDTVSDINVLGEGSGIALYTLDYDASDESGNYDGTPTDVTFGVDGQINWGASFNGSSSYIQADGIFSSSPSVMSASIWFKTTSDGSILDIGDNSVATAQNRIFFQSGLLYVTINGGGGGFATTSSTGLQDGNWHHLVAVWDDGTVTNGIKIYIDGASTPTAQGNSTESFNSALDLFIGANDNRAASSPNNVIRQHFDGLIDQVRIFNKELSSDEVETLYGETACVYTSTTDTVGFPSSASSNMFAYYKLDGSGEDESSNNHDGTEGSSMAYSFGRFGIAGSFDGSNNAVITIPDSDKFSPTVNDFSVSLWFNVSNTATNRLIAKGSNPYEWELYVSNGQLGYVGYSSAGVNHGVLVGGSSPGIYADGNWHHIVVTHDYGTKMEMFVDNVSLASLTTFTGYAMSNTTSSVTIGKRGDQSTSMTGMLDQIRFYDKILTTDEIEELYNEKQAYITKDASNPFGDGNEVAFYKFENNSNDSTGSNNGFDTSITYTSGSGIIGTYAADFNGTSSYISVTHNSSFNWTDNKTISLWVKFDSLGSGSIGLAAKSSNSSPYGWFLYKNGADNKIGFSHYNSSDASSLVISDNAVVTNIWYHICVTGDGTTNKLYINGTEEDSASAVTGTNVTDALVFGRFYSNIDNYYLDGNIDQVRFFDRTLDGDEVFKLYAEVIN